MLRLFTGFFSRLFAYYGKGKSKFYFRDDRCILFDWDNDGKPRRAGDIATCYADPTRAKEQLGWVAEKTLDDMCRDTWNFAKKHM